MTKLLLSQQHAKVILLLEGGYDCDAMAKSVCECVKVLLGEDELPLVIPKVPLDTLDIHALRCLKEVVATQAAYWTTLPEEEFKLWDPVMISKEEAVVSVGLKNLQI